MVLKFALTILVLAVLYGYIQNLTTDPIPEAKGSCTAEFKEVEKAYRAGYESGSEHGSSFSVYHKGQKVCDMWGGWADETNHIPWNEDTVSIYFSTTKAVSAITFALLHQRGLFSYDDLVSKYWPEFAQNGKDTITIRQLVSHQGGLAALDEDLSLEDLRENPIKVSKAIEKQKPNWTPGTAHGYHALSFSLMLDQIVRRVDPSHRALDQVFREDIAEPYGIEFDIGLPYAKQWRSARLQKLSGFRAFVERWTNIPTLKFMYKMMTSPDKMMFRSFLSPALKEEEYNWPATRATPLGSALGSGSARGVAKLFSIVSGPQFHDKAILSEETLRELITPQTGSRRERFFGMKGSLALGVFLNKLEENIVEYHHPGYGGQVGAGIKELHLGWSYVTNYLGFHLISFDDTRVQPLHEALIKAAKNNL